MAVFKCKMCGGTLLVAPGRSLGVCEFCGTTTTVPKTTDDRILNLFNRANDYRLQNEFDKALATYESILAEDNFNAEAHWGCVLSRYGIEYVEDPGTRKRIPTCHRVQNTAILADLEYKKALEYADDSSRTLYKKEAATISEIQKRILAIANREEAYDVFICYKETDEDGKRTRDSVFAQDIYYQLTDEGYKVFFARITLEDKLGQEYEPYIFAALNSAKVMLVVGTKPEYFNAVWVKNEWSRFLALSKTDRKKRIIPCYRDMDPYDLPEELSLFQSQDMGKIGFIQDLIHGIKKVIPKAPPAPTPQAPIPTPPKAPTPVAPPTVVPTSTKPTFQAPQPIIKEQKPQYTMVTHDRPKKRVGMNVCGIICSIFFFVVRFALPSYSLVQGMAFVVLLLMFNVLAKSPKESEYLCGKVYGMKKKTFVIICIIATILLVWLDCSVLFLFI